MTEIEHDEQSIGAQTDAEAVVEMVELLAHRRPREESRRHPRYPTAESLSGQYPPEAPFGWILCGEEAAQKTGNGGYAALQRARPHGSSGTETMEVISGFHVVDFSQIGMQIQYECGNFLKYSRRRLYLKVKSTTVPVSMQWFNGNEGIARAGISFDETIEHSPELGGVLVDLSDTLTAYLVRHYLAENILDYREIAVFAYLCILTSLRLRHVHALSTFYEAYAALHSYLESNTLSPGVASRLKHVLIGKVRQLHSPGKTIDPETRDLLIDAFMKAYQEYGCSISGKEGRVVFLEKEVMEVVSTCMFFEDSEVDRHKGLISQLRPIHAFFSTLRELVPMVFGNEVFDNQFSHYSRAISSVMAAREALIDLMSNLGSRLGAVVCPQPALGSASSGSSRAHPGTESKRSGMSAAAA